MGVASGVGEGSCGSGQWCRGGVLWEWPVV